MEKNNLEIELKRVEVIHQNINITLKNTQYNGFFGINGFDNYQNFLNEIYDEYFFELGQHIDKFLLNNNINDNLLLLLNRRIQTFNEIKEKFEEEKRDYDSYIDADRKEINSGNRNQSLREQYETLMFLREMSNIQKYYIYKTIENLENIYNNLTNNIPIKISSTNNTNTQLGRLKTYVYDYFEEYYKDKNELTNKDIESIFGIVRQTINNWETEGKLKRSINSRSRHILYLKQDVINNIIDGILPKKLATQEKK